MNCHSFLITSQEDGVNQIFQGTFYYLASKVIKAMRIIDYTIIKLYKKSLTKAIAKLL